jgi:DNA-binding CsgD family transcriptional regulator
LIKLDHRAVLNVVEAAYSTVQSDSSWKDRLAAAAFGLVGSADGFGVIQYRWKRDALGDFRITEVSDVRHTGQHVRWGEDAKRAHLAMPPALAEQVVARTGAMPASASGSSEHPVFRASWHPPIMDALGVVVCEPDGHGLALAIGARERFDFTARAGAMLNRVAFHLAAGFRLRLRGLHDMEDAEAILAPTGRVLHARGIAKTKRDSLDEGHRRRDEARTTTHDVGKALEIWKGLVAGRWSLVDHFDTDGKRFLLAMKNTPNVDKRADLTPRERRACALVAMGHRDKEVAYMLGISTASVSASLHRARRKLAVSSRAELVSLWRRAT